MNEAIIGLIGIIIGALLNEILLIVREKRSINIKRIRLYKVLNELMEYFEEISRSYDEKSKVWTIGHTLRIPEIAIKELEKLRTSVVIDPKVSINLMYVQQALKNLDENIRCFYKEKLVDSDQQYKEAQYVNSAASQLKNMIKRTKESLKDI